MYTIIEMFFVILCIANSVQCIMCYTVTWLLTGVLHVLTLDFIGADYCYTVQTFVVLFSLMYILCSTH